MEILTIGVVRYLTQTALLDMMAIEFPNNDRRNEANNSIEIIYHHVFG